MGARAKKDTEALLGELVTKVSPAELRVHLPRFAVIRERTAFEITAATRGVTISWSGKTLAEAAQEGLDYLETPTEDPWRGCWRRTTRMQREFVRALLLGQAADQTAKATAARIAGKQAQAHVDFELADALHAAMAEIDRRHLRGRHHPSRGFALGRCSVYTSDFAKDDGEAALAIGGVYRLRPRRPPRVGAFTSRRRLEHARHHTVWFAPNSQKRSLMSESACRLLRALEDRRRLKAAVARRVVAFGAETVKHRPSILRS